MYLSEEARAPQKPFNWFAKQIMLNGSYMTNNHREKLPKRIQISKSVYF